MSLKHVKEYTDTLPPHLLHSLRTVDIKDTEVGCIKTKLQERTSCSIVSYLQLVLIKLQKTSVQAQEFSHRMRAEQERTAFATELERRVSDLQSI
jgi:hypothetical protein